MSTSRTLFNYDDSRNEKLSRKPFGSAALKEINAVANYLGNQLFRRKQRIEKCDKLGVGVIDFADMEEEQGENEVCSKRNVVVRCTKTMRSPRSVLEKKVPINSSQQLQMDLILLDEYPSSEDLRRCTWKGCGPQNRAQVWRMLLGHEPLKYDARRSALEVKRNRYREYVDLLYVERELTTSELSCQVEICFALQKEVEIAIGPVRLGRASAREQPEVRHPMDVSEYAEYSIKTLRQIEMDLPRTHPQLPIFHVPEVRKPMKRVLYLYGMLNPKRNYVQGMNEILTPVVVVFLSSYLKGMNEKGIEKFLDREDIGKSLTAEELSDAEADAFWTFSLLVSSIEDNFSADQSGILRRVQRLEAIVREVDPLLGAHLERNGNEFIQFGCRWMNCLLMRELPFPLVVKLWDALLAEEDGMADLHVYFCAALIIRFRAELLSKGFEDCIMFLQHLPTDDWKTREVDFLLSQAFVWKEELKLPSLSAQAS